MWLWLWLLFLWGGERFGVGGDRSGGRDREEGSLLGFGRRAKLLRRLEGSLLESLGLEGLWLEGLGLEGLWLEES